MEHYPTLALIDRVLGNCSRPFSATVDGQVLESCARDLVADYWSDTVWSTGMVSETALQWVRDALERRRAELEATHRKPIDVKLVVIGPSEVSRDGEDRSLPWPLSRTG